MLKIVVVFSVEEELVLRKLAEDSGGTNLGQTVYNLVASELKRRGQLTTEPKEARISGPTPGPAPIGPDVEQMLDELVNIADGWTGAAGLNTADDDLATRLCASNLRTYVLNMRARLQVTRA